MSAQKLARACARLQERLGLAAMCELGSVLLLREPTLDLAAHLAKLCDWPELAHTAVVRAAALEWADLFANPASGRYVLPSESVLWEGRLAGSASVSVAKAYELAGFNASVLAAESCLGLQGIPDHLGLELAFAAWWLSSAADGPDQLAASETAQAQAWSAAHAGRMLPLLAAHLQAQATQPWFLFTADVLELLGGQLSLAATA